MFLFHALDGDLKCLKFVAVSDSDWLKTLDFDAKFIYNSPGNDLLSSDPGSSLLVISLSKEKLNVQQVSEATALENLNLDAWQEWLIGLCWSLLGDIFESTYELTVLLVDAVVQQWLEMTVESWELIDFKILAGL